MRILGITDGQTSGAALIEDGRIIAAINEERIVRLKMARGFPRKSIAEVFELSGVKPSEIDGVAVAQENMELREEVTGWPGWFEARSEDRDLHSAFFQVASRFGSMADKVPGLKKAYRSLRTPAFQHRRRRIPQILQEEFGITAPVRFINHHLAHAASAYCTCNFEDALVVTMDGGGDGHCSHIYSVRGGHFKRVCDVESYDSLGNYYAYITAILGYKAKRHEGKTTGLAAWGKPIYREMLESMIGYEDGRLVNRGRVLFNQAMEHIRRQLPEGWKKEDLACSIQWLAEDTTRDYVRYWVHRTGHRRVALAGGLFANVRINEEVHMIDGVDEVFVHPGMADEGLAVGAAFSMHLDMIQEKGIPWKPHRLDDVYFGNEYNEMVVADAVRQSGLESEYLPGHIEKEVAEKLVQGMVVARCAGRMEYGPRALGIRTILYQPNDPSVNDWLNELLRRTEFMPFAPATLEESTDQLFKNATGAHDTARFMTITFHCTDWMAERCGGVVHIDGTARPQIVRREDNPSYYKIIEEYYNRTGVPVVINTSFNVHEEPIVRTPHDAISAFLDSKLDYLAMGDFLLKGPMGSHQVRKKWEGRSKWSRSSTGSPATSE
ncbi:MAG: hypothetical protein KJ831_17625 [Candidatus Eisenbacteria bacterium]|nr:hypothetical protein [Candidatus Eisenbacteria bacterium]